MTATQTSASAGADTPSDPRACVCVRPRRGERSCGRECERECAHTGVSGVCPRRCAGPSNLRTPVPAAACAALGKRGGRSSPSWTAQGQEGTQDTRAQHGGPATGQHTPSGTQRHRKEVRNAPVRAALGSAGDRRTHASKKTLLQAKSQRKTTPRLPLSGPLPQDPASEAKTFPRIRDDPASAGRHAGRNTARRGPNGRENQEYPLLTPFTPDSQTGAPGQTTLSEGRSPGAQPPAQKCARIAHLEVGWAVADGASDKREKEESVAHSDGFHK